MGGREACNQTSLSSGVYFFSVGFNLRRGARKAMLAAAFPLVCWMRWRE
jgi:hypothetical protein